MGFQIIDPSNVSVNELLKVIKENCVYAATLKETLGNYEKTIPLKKDIVPVVEEEPIEIHDNSKEAKIDYKFEEEVEYYLLALSNLNDTADLKEQLQAVLPVKENYNYQKLIMRLKAELYKKIIDMKNLMKSDEKYITDEDKIEFDAEIDYYARQINLINTIVSERENETVVENPHKNHLIFVPTSGGNIRVLEELNKIPDEYYQRFLELFDSIKNGTFKGVKRFESTNTNNGGICEVRGKSVRILFDRIGPDSYAVISAFVKKCVSNSNYKTNVTHSIVHYRNCQRILKSNLNNEDFMNLQAEYEKELYQLLGTNDIKASVLKKGSVDNE